MDTMTTPKDPTEVYMGLRAQILAAVPERIGITSSPALPHVWGVLIDIGAATGSATIVGLADGTTSMYTSSGGGVIGGGFVPPVRAATRALLETVEYLLSRFTSAPSPDLPPPGVVSFTVLGYDGRTGVSARQADLDVATHPLAAPWAAVHGVMSQLRIHQAQREGAGTG
jgi:hypothetical protein